MKRSDPLTKSPTLARLSAAMRTARLDTVMFGEANVTSPTRRTNASGATPLGVAMYSTSTLPPDQSPVGTMIRWPCASSTPVMSTTSASGDETDKDVTAAPKRPAAPASNVKVAPWAANPAIAYATRNVALPEMRAPTEPPIEDDAMVALPLNEIGPEIDREPEAPAVRMFVEM